MKQAQTAIYRIVYLVLVYAQKNNILCTGTGKRGGFCPADLFCFCVKATNKGKVAHTIVRC